MVVRDIPTFLTFLKKVHGVKKFEHYQKEGKRMSLDFQYKKHLEEMGEFEAAVQVEQRGEQMDEPSENELWDYAISALACAMGPEFELTNEKILEGLDRVVEKLSRRTGVPVP